MERLSFSYDQTRDEMTIEGNRFSGDFFRAFNDMECGQTFRFLRRDDVGKTIWIERLEPPKK